MDVSGLLFDGDDVLYDATMWRRWLLQLLGRLGLHTHYDAFYRVWEREFLDEVNQGRRDYWEALRAFLKSSGLSRGQIDEVVAASHARHRQLQESARPLAGVLATTAQLSGSGIPMAVLCNSPMPAAKLETLLGKLGLAGRFQAVLSSVDLGYTKPAAESYRAALDAMHMDASQVAFVGHDTIELHGAAEAGLSTIAINHAIDAKADIYLDRIEQLLSAVHYRSSRLLAG